VDVICKAIDAQAGREDLIDHLAFRHLFTLQQLELADDSVTRIMGLPLGVLLSVHSTCVQREELGTSPGSEHRSVSQEG
jgi:hypothetical protein